MVNSEYDEIWHSLNQTVIEGVCPRWNDTSKASHAEIMRHFAAIDRTTIINLRALSTDDKEVLACNQISLSCLKRNLKRSLKPRYYDPCAFQDFAVKSGAIHAVCPFTGKPVTSRHSLLANIGVIFFRFETQRVFYVVSAGIGRGFEKGALYFPSFDLIVTAGDEWGFQREDLFELKARVVANGELCHQYLSNASARRTKVAACVGFYHFAHHLWNELSGLQRLQKANLLGKIDDFFVAREPLGRLDHLFPEIPESRIHRVSDTDALFKMILSSGSLAIKVGGDFVARELIERVHKVAESSAAPTTLKKIMNARQAHSLLLWIGIRVGNRSWADQAEGLSSLIKLLAAEFPRMGIVFDGFSMPADKLHLLASDDQARELIEKENAEVERIVRRVEMEAASTDVEIINIIGCSILEAILWARAIDYYLSPYGSLQHKVAWFANKPGIIHSNRTMLQSPAEYVSKAVEGLIHPHYLDSSSIQDVLTDTIADVRYNEIADSDESGAGVLMINRERRANPEFHNYTVDLMGLRKDLVEMIRSRSASNRRAAPASIALKRRLRNTLRTLTTALDLRIV